MLVDPLKTTVVQGLPVHDDVGGAEAACRNKGRDRICPDLRRDSPN